MKILNEPFAEGTFNEKCHLLKNAMNTLSVREKVKPFIDFEKSTKGKKMIEEHGYYIIEEK